MIKRAQSCYTNSIYNDKCLSYLAASHSHLSYSFVIK